MFNKFGSHWVSNKFVQFHVSSGQFWYVSCSSANELHQNSNASSREDYIPQTLTVLLEINSILCIYIWPLWWPFVFCPSFVNNSINNVPTSSTNQCFWLDSRQILRHQYGISVTELQPFFCTKRPQQRRASRNGCFCRLLSSKVSWFGHYALVNSRCTCALPEQLLGI